MLPRYAFVQDFKQKLKFMHHNALTIVASKCI